MSDKCQKRTFLAVPLSPPSRASSGSHPTFIQLSRRSPEMTCSCSPALWRAPRGAEVVGEGAEVAAAAEFAAAAFVHEAMLTNLGVLTFEDRFGRLKLEGLFGPAVLDGMESEQTIGVATVGGSICLTHTSHTPPEGLLEAMRSVLTTGCQ